MPFVEIVSKTSPIIPIGANLMINSTTLETASEKLDITNLVESAELLKANPSINAHDNIPI